MAGTVVLRDAAARRIERIDVSSSDVEIETWILGRFSCAQDLPTEPGMCALLHQQLKEDGVSNVAVFRSTSLDAPASVSEMTFMVHWLVRGLLVADDKESVFLNSRIKVRVGDNGKL